MVAAQRCLAHVWSLQWNGLFSGKPQSIQMRVTMSRRIIVSLKYQPEVYGGKFSNK